MKKHESIMRMVEKAEQKAGIVYARPNGALFKGIRTCYTLAYLYELFWSITFVGGALFMHYASQQHIIAPVNYETDKSIININVFITVCICTALIIVGWIFLYSKLKTVGCIVSIPTLCVQLFSFRFYMGGAEGVRSQFYWMHLVPIVIMLLLLIWMLIIIFRAIYYTNTQYKRIVSNLYDKYHEKIVDSRSGISDEEWEEFLENYDPHGYQQQFSEKDKK